MRRAAGLGLAALVGLAGCTTGSPVPPITRPPSVAQRPSTVVSASAAAICADPAGRCDPYYPSAGNGGYDVSHYDLDVRYDPGTRAIAGEAAITATATTSLRRFNLDLHGLTVDAVTVDGRRAQVTRTDDELVITPDAPIGGGATFATRVRYHGVPQPYRRAGEPDMGLLTSADGAVAIGEPMSAAAWFPANDHPSDKATFRVRVTAPNDDVALANGRLVGRTRRAAVTTWTWQTNAPMATYLATVVVGDYRVRYDTYQRLPMVLAVSAALSSSVDEKLAVTPRVLDFLGGWFGPYPFDAVGGIVVRDPRVRYALETQTRPIYSDTFFAGDRDGSWVVAHELAHQWVGDSVSVRDWRDIWLNEGFATYAEWLWRASRGEVGPQERFDENYAHVDADIWRVRPGDPGRDQLFHDAVYVRGAMTLHALRITVGDEAFRRILREWAASRAGSVGTTGEFVALAQRISGQDLGPLFRAWLYGTSRPPRPRD